jgi:hypothetical protein
MDTCLTRSAENVDCIVGWDARNSKIITEHFFVPKFIYAVTVHKNMKSFLAGDTPISEEVCPNIVTLQGKNLINNVMFGTLAKISTWYILIFDTDTTCVNTMTYAAPVFTESVDYSESTRPEYIDVPSISQVMTNSASRAVFTMTGTPGTIYGCGLVGGANSATKGNTTESGNYLYSASLFSEPKTVIATNVLSIAVSITQS